MFSIVPFKKEHLEVMRQQPANIEDGINDFIASGTPVRLEKLCSFTGLWNGVPVVSGGVIEYWHGRGQLWSWFNCDMPKGAFVAVFRGFKKFLKVQPYRRVEMSIRAGDKHAGRRADMLGFKLECSFAQSYLPDGADCALYSLVRS